MNQFKINGRDLAPDTIIKRDKNVPWDEYLDMYDIKYDKSDNVGSKMYYNSFRDNFNLVESESIDDIIDNYI